MLLPLVVAFLAVVAGAALALGPEEGAAATRPIRVLAIAAAVLVIGTHLLPEAYAALGVYCVLGFVGGLGVPLLTERLFATLSRERADRGAAAVLELSYVGLVVHRFGDGLSMGAAGAAPESAWSRAAVVFAIALHIVPVTTVMILAILAQHGRRSAVVRAGILAVSTMAGVVVATFVVNAGEDSLSPWISAVVAGLLLHVVIHDLPGRHAHDHSPGNRAA